MLTHAVASTDTAPLNKTQPSRVESSRVECRKKKEHMKTAVLTLSVLPLLAATSYQAAAGDREWATAGKVLTGLVAAQVISQAVHPAPYYAPAPVYYAPPPVVMHPAPVYVQPAPVYYPAPPVVHVRPAPIFVPPPLFFPPRPSFSFHLGFGHHGHHGHHRHHGHHHHGHRGHHGHRH